MKHYSILLAVALFVAASCSGGDKVSTPVTNVTDFYAHRGGRHENDENTMQAFKQCVSIGVNRFETDVRMAADGTLIISHDANLKRRTGFDGIIEKMTCKEITSKKTFLGNNIPTVEEVVKYLARAKATYVEFEMKTTEKELYPDNRIPEYCEALYALVKKYQPKNTHWAFTSFDPRPLKYLHAKDPQAHIGYITGRPVCEETIAEALEAGADQIDAGHKGTTKEAVEAAHAAGLSVCLWPGSSYANYLDQKALGSDRMCTDIPNLLSLEVEKAKAH